MFDFTLALTDAVLPVQLPTNVFNDLEAGQWGDPNAPGKPPQKIFLSALDIGQGQDPNPPGKPPQS